jgi:branched-chain amino acid transport system substrate-binding protein
LCRAALLARAADAGVRLLSVAIVALASLGAMTEKPRESAATDREIRIGNLMPYTGALSAFAGIGKAEAAYFDLVNAQGGINGRKLRFISHDDSSDPSIALDLTRGLVERDGVQLMFSSFGTPGNLAVRRYLNEKKIPQLFVVSGDEAWNDPKAFPWSMGWQPSFRAEGRIYANYIQAFHPDNKIVALWQNDEFGRDLYRGFEEGLGDLKRMIRVDIAFEIADPAMETHISILKRSGADIFLFAGAPDVAAKVIKIAASLNWHPVFILDSAAASIGTLKPAGQENAAGVISASFLKDANDPAWKDDAATREWLSFMNEHLPSVDKDDSAAIYGYAAARTLVQVLKQCRDDLSPENIMRQAASLKDYQAPMMLPGIAINTDADNFGPIRKMRLVQFDGRTWQPIGDIIEDAFSDARKK